MAGYKGHITASLIFCSLLYVFPFWEPLPILGKMGCVALAVFFGLWPDVDTKSKGQYLFFVLILGADLILIYQQDYKKAAYVGLLSILPLLSRHRGWTHSAAAMIMIPVGLYGLAVHYGGGNAIGLLPYLAAALLGYASHLIVDRF